MRSSFHQTGPKRPPMTVDDPFKHSSLGSGVASTGIPRAALDLAEAAFGFERSMVVKATPTEGSSMPRCGSATATSSSILNGPIMSPALLRSPARTRSRSHVQAEGRHRRPLRAGAGPPAPRIIQEPTDQFYGERQYRARDPEGHVWTFTADHRVRFRARRPSGWAACAHRGLAPLERRLAGRPSWSAGRGLLNLSRPDLRDSEVCMERLAGRIILLWGWRRALVAFLAGALAVLGQAPYDFFAACFISFPLAGLAARRRRPARVLRSLSATPAAGLRRRLVVRLRLLSSPASGGSARRCWSRPTVSPGRCPSPWSAFRPRSPFSTALRHDGRALLWSSDIGRIAACLRLRAGRWLRGFLFTGFPWNADRLRGHARALADAERLGDRHDRHERARCVRLRHCRRCWRARRHLRLGAALFVVARRPPHVDFGYAQA